MAEEEDLLGTKIGMLLKITECNDGDVSTEARQRHDRRRLQQLGVATTSGDTLVIVRFPAGKFIDCDGYKWETKEFFMDSEKLRATGSSVFAAQLSPEAQAQTRRCLDYDSKSYPEADYVLDLTPPIEGVESASLVAQLSLSDGLRNWWQSCYISSVSKCLVSGHDDVCLKHLDLFFSVCHTDRHLYPTVTINNLKYPESRKIVDYCPIRHRAAILRLLMDICQGDLVLDSAPRTATMIVVAKYFDCVKVVKDSVLAWFMSVPNQEFMHVNAEDALWMGWMVELRAVTRAAFRVLVVEKALEILDIESAVNNGKRQLSILGRTRGSIADEQETCIQHAAQKLAQRAGSLYAQLMSDDVSTYLGIKQWPVSSPVLCRTLNNYIRGLVSDALKSTNVVDENFHSMMEEYDSNRARYVSTINFVSTKDIYLDLSPQQCILTTAFWRQFSELASMPEKLYNHVRFETLKIRQPSNQAGLEAEQSLFDRDAFHSEFLAGILDLSTKWIGGELEINTPNTGLLVLSLTDEEFKFLPLWAGGLDDGTGSVYQPDIPDAERGVPIGPGPGFYTGETIPDDRSSTLDGDRATTTLTGMDTVSMTSGYSIRPANSQVTGLVNELAAAIIGVQLTTANPNVQEDTTVPQVTQTATTADEVFDWSIGASGDHDAHSDDDFNSDSDSDSDDGSLHTAAAVSGGTRYCDNRLEDSYPAPFSGDNIDDRKRR
ncbi:hypothetical protein F4859DRAFT_124345 [Xylaria cf. heliscus]|nr:hypothetical protein F4859DRAFT_124345 [Xylaria cf. heliscus]